MKRLAINLPALLMVLLSGLPSPCLAREQSQMVEPPGPPPSAPIGSSAAQNSFAVPVPVGADFWKTGAGGMLANSLSPGTVLAGILQQDISSNKSNPGDVFTLLLPYGGQSDGKQIVPPGSKIIGVIKSATPAKSLRFGQPGNIEVSLQSLVLPDGRSVRFHGFIDHNANLDPRTQPKTRQAGPQISDYGNYFKSFFLQFPAGLGRAMNAQHQGADYSLKQGESIPIRVTQGIGLPPPIAPPVGPMLTGYPQLAPPLTGYRQSVSGYQQPFASTPGVDLVPGQTYPNFSDTGATARQTYAPNEGSQLSRIMPGSSAPEPGILTAGPQLRSEMGTGQQQLPDAQGIHATPLTLDNN